ncbi:MAG: LytR/AlgR family response regulator transcription factor [Myxococcota bacterium]
MTAARRLRTVVVDDEPLARDELVFLLGQCEGVEVVGQAADASTALDLCDQESPDAAFVDLRMPGPDGIALAEAVKSRHPGMPIVIVSAHDDGAIRAFEAQVLDYLVKPVRLERLKTAVDRVRRTVRPEPEEGTLTRLAVRRRGAYHVVDLEDVVFFEMRDELVWAVTPEDRYALDLTLSAVEQRVPKDRFFRSHRSAIVRLDRIRTIEPSGPGTYELLMDHPDQPRVPLARERARMLREVIPFTG